jgi:hypothetical protein
MDLHLWERCLCQPYKGECKWSGAKFFGSDACSKFSSGMGLCMTALALVYITLALFAGYYDSMGTWNAMVVFGILIWLFGSIGTGLFAEKVEDLNKGTEVNGPGFALFVVGVILAGIACIVIGLSARVNNKIFIGSGVSAGYAHVQ